MINKIRWLNIIRIIGIILVVLYHFTDFLPGGFFGVDVFLTLSGFLITAHVMENLRLRKHFGFVHFIKRRFSRIYPPLFMMVIICLPLALLIPPDFTAAISYQAAAALSFTTNYYEIINGGSYEAQMLPHFLVHTWFLSVEIQIYIFWGLFLAAISGYSIKHNADGKKAVFLSAAVLSVLSFIHMQILYTADPSNPSVAYFGTTSRAFPFFIGALTGALAGLQVKTPRKREIVPPVYKHPALYCIIGITAVITAMSFLISFSDAITYRFGILFTSLLTAAMILLFRQLHSITPKGVDEPAVLSFCAGMTYGIYLFHWPLYIVIKNLSFAPGKAASGAVAIVLSILLSVLVTNLAHPVLKSSKWSAAKISVCAVMLCLVVLSTATIVRAPVISTLEEGQYLGALFQDSQRIQHTNFLSTVSVSSTPVGVEHEISATPRPQSADDTNAQSIDGDSAHTFEDTSQSPPPQTPSPDTGQQTTASPPDTPSDTHTDTPAEIPSDTPYSVDPTPMLWHSLAWDEIPAGGVLIIGDSVLMGAIKELYTAIPGLISEGGSSVQMWQGYDIIIDLQEKGELPETVLVSLGTNTNKNTVEYIDKIINDINPGHRLVFVVPYIEGYGEGYGAYTTAQYLKSLKGVYDYVTIADWAAAVEASPHSIGGDGIHIGGHQAGIALMVEVVTTGLRASFKTPVKS